MTSIFDLLELAEGIRVVYELGYEPRAENFVELTAAQYRALKAQGEDTRERWYRITRGIFEDRNNPPPELRIVSEPQREQILRAAEVVRTMSDEAGKDFPSFEARLAWLRTRLPPVLTLPYER